jgi:hypothetical protein
MKNLMILSLLLLTACSKYNVEQEDFQDLPPGLADCKFYRLTDAQGSQSLIARCPNSTTSAKKVDSKLPDVIVIDKPPESSVPPASSVEESKAIEQPGELVGPVLKN